MKRSQVSNCYDERLVLGYLVTLVTGLVMVYSTSSILAESRFGSHLFFFKQQLMWAALSLVTVYVLYRLDLKKLAVYSAPALLLTLFLLSLVFVLL